MKQPLVMVVDRHGKITLGSVLSDDILVQKILDLSRFQQVFAAERSGGLPADGHLAVDKDLMAVFDALVADVGSVCALEHEADLVAPGTAEGTAVDRVVAACAAAVASVLRHCFSRLVSTSSMRP